MTVEDANRMIDQLSLSPDQQLVLRVIQKEVPMIWNDVLFQLKYG